MNASVYRNTAFELVSLQQGANQFRVVVVSRTAAPSVNPNGGLVPPPAVTLDLDESMFSDEEMQRVHDILGLLEDKATLRYNEWTTEPARAVEAVNAAVEAEARRKVAERETQRLDEERAAKLAELATLDAELAVKRGRP